MHTVGGAVGGLGRLGAVGVADHHGGSCQKGFVLYQGQRGRAVDGEGAFRGGRHMVICAYHALKMYRAAFGGHGTLRKIFRGYIAVADARYRQQAGLAADRGPYQTLGRDSESFVWKILVDFCHHRAP